MVLEAAGLPLVPAELDRPEAGPVQVLLRVRACGEDPSAAEAAGISFDDFVERVLGAVVVPTA